MANDDKDKDKKESSKKKKNVLGWGMAEKTRKTLKNRKSRTDQLIDEISTGKPKKKKKKD